MARINQRNIDTIATAQRYAARVNNHNSAAITAAQNAFVACKCHVCTDKSIPATREQCAAERKLWAEIERGEDMQIAARTGEG